MGAGASIDSLSLDGELKELLSYYDGNLESAADSTASKKWAPAPASTPSPSMGS